MQSSKPRPSCSVELKFVQMDEFSVQLTTFIDNKVERIEAFKKDQLFLASEPSIKDIVRKAIQRL